MKESKNKTGHHGPKKTQKKWISRSKEPSIADILILPLVIIGFVVLPSCCSQRPIEDQREKDKKRMEELMTNPDTNDLYNYEESAGADDY